jgi:translation initiation factor IF-2
VLVKRGTLHIDDIFVCGTDEGKIRFMINDKGENIGAEAGAYPGQAVVIGGYFKHIPEIGHSLYACKTHEEALYMATRIKSRRERERE